MKKFSLILAFCMIVSMFAGCAGTPVVYYSDCTCPADSHVAAPVETTPNTDPVTVEGELKTGLGILCGVDAVDASAEENGEAEYNVTLVGILVDENDVIADCAIDSIGVTIQFDNTGAITSDVTAEVLTKNEKGDSYGMVAYGNARAEWYEQAEALAQYCIGKTIYEIEEGTVDESGYAADADLASSATINLADYVNGIITAYNNAQYLGAHSGDELVLTSISSTESTTDGNAQLDVNATALTMNGDVITSCYIDALQAKVSIDGTGAASIGNTMTKNELGYDYGMVGYGNATYEWFEQAASFATYVTGKTAEDVANIAVVEGKAADADLAASVTISIGDFQDLIAKAAKQ